MARKGPPFKITGKVKATGRGCWYATTEPEHPNALTLPDRKKKYVYLHVVVMENHLGRLIDPKTEEVHHKDGDTSNNRVSNLEVRKKSSHKREHAKKEEFWKTSPRNKPGRKSALRVIQAFKKKASCV